MTLLWLKRYVPRGLYGRTALILVLPVVAVQLVVSVAFIQRHLEDVTSQMTVTMTRELQLVTAEVDAAGTRAEAMERIAPLLAAFDMTAAFLSPDEAAVPNTQRWYDFSAGVVTRTMRGAMPDFVSASFPPDRSVIVRVRTDQGPMSITFSRRRLTVAAPHQLIVTMIFFGLLMTGVAFIYMRNQLRPILRLARAAEAFGRGRNVPYVPGGAVEVRAAGGAFLDMRARIERAIEQRTMMLYGVSHDLRTPLTRLRLGLSMLDDEEARHLVSDVDEMQRLLDTFLDFARDSSEGETVPVDPHALVSQAVEDARRLGRDVSVAGTEGEGTVMLRPVAMGRAVANLIGNAVQYGTRAEVSVALTEKALRIRVEDDGPGIPPEAREQAVKPFARLDPARNQNRGSGVGLGLAIVNDVARAHGGTLRLGQSDRLGGLQADIVIGR